MTINDPYKDLVKPLTDEQRDKALALLQKWCDADEAEAQEQRETGEYLMKALNEGRDAVGARRLFDGPADLSERSVRKQAAYDAVDERHQKRFGADLSGNK